MDTETGRIREVKQGDQIGPREVLVTANQAKRLSKVPPEQRAALYHEMHQGEYAKMRNSGKSPRSCLPKSLRKWQ